VVLVNVSLLIWVSVVWAAATPAINTTKANNAKPFHNMRISWVMALFKAVLRAFILELRASGRREPETRDWGKTITPRQASVNAQNLLT
jgi:hypothetical protein